MKIMVNGADRAVAAANLADLLAECGFSGRVATAVNESFVPEAARAAHLLREGDRVEILAPMQGG